MGREGGDNEETRDTVFEGDNGIVASRRVLGWKKAMAFSVIGVQVSRETREELKRAIDELKDILLIYRKVRGVRGPDSDEGSVVRRTLSGYPADVQVSM